MTINLGFTGSRRRIDPRQRATLAFLLWLTKPTEIHHGDCIGADDLIDELAYGMGIPRIIHPPTDSKCRAFCPRKRPQDATHLPAKPYLKRNQDIVQASTVLLATPPSAVEHNRLGTWSTIRYARERGVPIVIILPDGTVRLEIP